MEKGFKKEDLVELAAGDEVQGLVVLEDKITGRGRWSINYQLIFKDTADGKCYRIVYSVGATEQQDERPFEGEADLILCQEVIPVNMVKTEYELAKTWPEQPKDEERGLFHKYVVQRVDGSSRPGGKHAECFHYVLDLTHDPHARPAILAYAKSCKLTHPKLSEDLIKRVNQGVKFHLYEDDDGNIYAAHTMREAWEAQSEETMWTPELEGWSQLPDDHKLTDSEGQTKTAAEHAEEYRQNNLVAGCIGGPT